MIEPSIGCVNGDTYGVSCVKCKKCGRKFTNDGIDDSEVIATKVESYSNFLQSDFWKDIEININIK